MMVFSSSSTTSTSSRPSTQLHPAKLISGSDVTPAAPDRAASLQEQLLLRPDTHHTSATEQHNIQTHYHTAFTVHFLTAQSRLKHHGQRTGKKSGFYTTFVAKITPLINSLAVRDNHITTAKGQFTGYQTLL